MSCWCPISFTNHREYCHSVPQKALLKQTSRQSHGWYGKTEQKCCDAWSTSGSNKCLQHIRLIGRANEQVANHSIPSHTSENYNTSSLDCPWNKICHKWMATTVVWASQQRHLAIFKSEVILHWSNSECKMNTKTKKSIKIIKFNTEVL